MASSVHGSEPAVDCIVILSVRNQAGRRFRSFQVTQLTLALVLLHRCAFLFLVQLAVYHVGF